MGTARERNAGKNNANQTRKGAGDDRNFASLLRSSATRQPKVYSSRTKLQAFSCMVFYAFEVT
jgi:hypothetical protein